MSLIELILLSLLQGITEFFPVSSSGHLTLAQKLLGYQPNDELLFLNLVLHLGTVTAITIGLWTTIRSLSRRDLYALCIALFPLFPLILVMKPLKEILGTDYALSVGFMAGGLYILWGEQQSPSEKQERSLYAAFWIGIAQTLAVFPGVSRLGSTSATARLHGWSRTNAVTFSFLLAIPTVLGGVLIEARDLIDRPDPALSIPPLHYGIGFLIALASGLLALRMILRLAANSSFRVFGYYCIIVGLAMIMKSF